MKKIQKSLISLILVLALAFAGLWGCAKSQPHTIDETPENFLYFINSSFTSLIPYSLGKNAELPQTEELLNLLNVVPSGEGYVAPLDGISVMSEELSDGKLTLELGREYEALKGIREVLVRAAIVKTLVQDPAIHSVEILVGGSPILNSAGEPIGSMDKNTFVDYFGKEQDALLSENLTIYYATNDGSGLVREVHRVYYENSLSLEQAVIKCMLDHPETSGAQVAISPKINIINITTTDGRCYLDMDSSFFDVNSNISQTIALKAIVNSLCELDGVRNVQVGIIGTNEEAGNAMLENVSGSYEKDSSLVINP